VPAVPASTRPPSTRRRRLLFGFAAVFVGLVVAVGVAELVLRICDPLRLPAEELRGFYRLDARGRIETTPGWSGQSAAAAVHMNALGLRGPDLPARGANEKRVLMLGDSFVWGLGVGDGETIPARLEQALRASGAPVTVANAGMPGTSPREWSYTLDRFRAPCGPDLVVATMYVGNDVLDALQEPLSVVDGWLMTAGPAGVARTSWRFRMMVTSRLWFYVEALLLRNTLKDVALASIKPIGPGIALAEALFLDRDPARDAELPFLGEVEATLAADFREFARASEGLRRVVVLLPAHEVALRDYGELLKENGLDPALHQRGRGHARLARLLGAQGIEVIDLTARLLAEPDRKALFFAQDWHFNQAGCRKVAEWLQPELEARLR
jgi:lysophospholipase L1-like esterase